MLEQIVFRNILCCTKIKIKTYDRYNQGTFYLYVMYVFTCSMKYYLLFLLMFIIFCFRLGSYKIYETKIKLCSFLKITQKIV